MSQPFVIVVADDWGFRSRCHGALVAAGYRVAAPTTKEAAEYFLASAYPPDVVVFSRRERWEELLREPLRRTVRPIATAIVGREETPGAARAVEEAVRAALEQLAREPIAWRDELTLGMEIIDASHRAQLTLLGAFEAAARDGRRMDGMDRLREIQDQAEAHFSDEESLMQLHGCHDREEHAREHARLLQEVRELARRWSDDDRPQTARFILSLRDWLEGHMRTLDRALAECLARNDRP